jgi:hypothetical protein
VPSKASPSSIHYSTQSPLSDNRVFSNSRHNYKISQITPITTRPLSQSPQFPQKKVRFSKRKVIPFVVQSAQILDSPPLSLHSFSPSPKGILKRKSECVNAPTLDQTFQNRPRPLHLDLVACVPQNWTLSIRTIPSLSQILRNESRNPSSSPTLNGRSAHQSTFPRTETSLNVLTRAPFITDSESPVESFKASNLRCQKIWTHLEGLHYLISASLTFFFLNQEQYDPWSYLSIPHSCRLLRHGVAGMIWGSKTRCCDKKLGYSDWFQALDCVAQFTGDSLVVCSVQSLSYNSLSLQSAFIAHGVAGLSQFLKVMTQPNDRSDCYRELLACVRGIIQSAGCYCALAATEFWSNQDPFGIKQLSIPIQISIAYACLYCSYYLHWIG